MAHTCPICHNLCHCNGDIDDINFGESETNCICCQYEDYELDEDETDEICLYFGRG